MTNLLCGVSVEGSGSIKGTTAKTAVDEAADQPKEKDEACPHAD
jgi:hypothetical protein